MTAVHLTSKPSSSPPAASSLHRRMLEVFRLVLIRLRFVLMLLLILAVIACWDTLRMRWDRLLHPAHEADEAVSIDTEYWCPMCPGIVSAWPGKCPVCNMALLRRKKGEPAPLPDGVLTRMQLTPYRMQLAGVRTSIVEYRPLRRDIALAGFVERGPRPTQREVKAEVSEQELPFLEVGQRLTASSDLFPAHPPFEGTISKLGPYLPGGARSLGLHLLLDDPQQLLRPGMLLTVRLSVPPTRRPWAAQSAQEEWRDRLCLELVATSLARPTGPVRPGGAETLVRAAAALAMLRADCVLAVPDSAVIDTGSCRIVYVESMPGMFDGVEVVLGPRCGNFYSVLRGLEPGQKVATAGAFLVDAEARLNLGAAASYFGSTGKGSSPPPPLLSSATTEKGLAAADKALAELQKTCPVTDEPLDCMGGPVRVEIDGRVVFLCCKGCEEQLRQNLHKYLPKLPPAAQR